MDVIVVVVVVVVVAVVVVVVSFMPLLLLLVLLLLLLLFMPFLSLCSTAFFGVGVIVEAAFSIHFLRDFFKNISTSLVSVLKCVSWIWLLL